jgi:uncharacterized protein (TIGR03083 family)
MPRREPGTNVEIDVLVDGIAVEGHRLADAAESAGVNAEVPSCPSWNIRDLVRHTGGVMHWAGEHVRTPQVDVISAPNLETQLGGWPSDADLFEWFRGEVDLLVESLRLAPDDIETAAFLPAPSPKHFWARRQCHEIEIHRIDAELAAGDQTPVNSERAADGIDEILRSFASRPNGKLRSARKLSMLIEPDDVTQRWFASISDEPLEVSDDPTGPVDLTVRGSADGIYRCLWNRADLTAVRCDGNVEPLTMFKERIKIRWS